MCPRHRGTHIERSAALHRCRHTALALQSLIHNDLDRVHRESGLSARNEMGRSHSVTVGRCGKGQATSSCSSTPPQQSDWVVCVTRIMRRWGSASWTECTEDCEQVGHKHHGLIGHKARERIGQSQKDLADILQGGHCLKVEKQSRGNNEIRLAMKKASSCHSDEAWIQQHAKGWLVHNESYGLGRRR